MKEQSGHITSKVILGYILLITSAVCSVAYIYNIVEKVAEEDEPDHQARRKVYLVTNTLSLLYESEALGQLVGTVSYTHLDVYKRQVHRYDRDLFDNRLGSIVIRYLAEKV